MKPILNYLLYVIRWFILLTCLLPILQSLDPAPIAFDLFTCLILSWSLYLRQPILIWPANWNLLLIYDNLRVFAFLPFISTLILKFEPSILTVFSISSQSSLFLHQFHSYTIISNRISIYIMSKYWSLIFLLTWLSSRFIIDY